MELPRFGGPLTIVQRRCSDGRKTSPLRVGVPAPGRRAAPDLVERRFQAQAPNRLWVADITYVPTWARFVFLAVVLDVFSRRIVGWSMADHLRTELVLEALNMAVGQRRPEAVIHHPDRGTQYTSLAFGKRCREMGVRPSTGSVGDCYDNAMAESFFATLECELIDRRSFRTRAQAKREVFDFVERWYNLGRRHSALGYLSPNDFERAAAGPQPAFAPCPNARPEAPNQDSLPPSMRRLQPCRLSPITTHQAKAINRLRDRGKSNNSICCQQAPGR